MSAEMPTSLEEIFASDDDGLLDEPEKAPVLTGHDRLRRSFVEINDFVVEHGREPDPTVRAIQERRLGARLDGIRANPEKVEALADLDEHGLLAEGVEEDLSLEDILALDDDLLDDETGILDTSMLPKKITRGEPEWVARRERAKGFEAFEPLFKQKHAELRSGVAGLAADPGEAHIQKGTFFVLGGVMLFVAEVGETEVVAGRRKERLRVIFENGTESSMYRQSLTSRLHEEDSFLVTQREVTITELEAGDELTGHIYVLRSRSDHPEVVGRPNLHKIGFTRGSVERRLAGAEKQVTYLMAPVEVVADYKTYNLRAASLEHLLHTVFATSRVPFEQVGLDGRAAEASEWFDVSLEVIDRALTFVQDGSIVNWVYDRESGTLKPRVC